MSRHAQSFTRRDHTGASTKQEQCSEMSSRLDRRQRRLYWWSRYTAPSLLSFSQLDRNSCSVLTAVGSKMHIKHSMLHLRGDEGEAVVLR